MAEARYLFVSLAVCITREIQVYATIQTAVIIRIIISILIVFIIMLIFYQYILVVRAKEAGNKRLRLPRKSIWVRGVTDTVCEIRPFVRSLALVRQKYLTNFALRFPRNLADGIPRRGAVFYTPRGWSM